ncbi:MAG: hypothetical protein AAGI25_18825, partial [Bacteroidota bacterium]
MEKDALRGYFAGLSAIERQLLIEELQQFEESESLTGQSQQIRRSILDHKQGCCAHCGHTKYV